MINYILCRPELFSSVLGITYKQFREILREFSRMLRAYEQERYIQEGKRRRVFGGGRKSKALGSDEGKLFFILFYYKVYPTIRLAECIFELDHTNVLRWKEYLGVILNIGVGYKLYLPIKRVRCLKELIDVCPDLREVIVDVTERPIRRPQDKAEEVRYYSGKRKDHTIKNQILVNPISKKIVYVSRCYHGRKHDKRIFEEDKIWLKAPPDTTILGDGAYTAIDQLSPYIKLAQPFKKPVGGELTESQKETNRVLSSIRVNVEHPFAYMKHFNILRHDFRNRLEKADLVFETIACIYNISKG